MTIFKKGLDGLEVLVFVPGDERIGLPWDNEKPVVTAGPGISDTRYVSDNRQEFDPDTVVVLPGGSDAKRGHIHVEGVVSPENRQGVESTVHAWRSPKAGRRSSDRPRTRKRTGAGVSSVF